MPNTSQSPCLLICHGKDCAKKSPRETVRLTQVAVSAGIEVDTVACQGACTGPTAVVLASGGPRWFEGLKSRKLQVDVCALALGETRSPSKQLAKQELTGKARKKAAKRFAKVR